MKKYKIGYTTGVFDMFHIGHLNILRRAKEQCEYLIVGVSTDELVKSYKNKFPIIPLEERIAIVEQIKYVDQVVIQHSMDKLIAWEKYKFNVIFHGSDWMQTNLYNRMIESFKNIDVDVVFFPYTEGVSSTKLAETLQKNKKNSTYNDNKLSCRREYDNVVNKKYCMSSYLALRYIENENMNFFDGLTHKNYTPIIDEAKRHVYSAKDIDEALKNSISEIQGKKGILLSGGMDSAIIASHMVGCDAFTFRFLDGRYQEEELKRAEYYANYYNLNLHYVDISWETVEKNIDILMEEKGAPIHPIEPQILQAGLNAKDYGIEILLVGESSDLVFGGYDQLLSQDWKFEDFVKRYTFTDPFEVLEEAENILDVFERYRKGVYIDYLKFMDEVFSAENSGCFENSLSVAKMPYMDPYAQLKMGNKLDLYRIRNGEPKYLIRELFAQKYPKIPIPNKLPMPRPVDYYFENWEGPRRYEFKKNLDMNKFTGNQKWQIYCLERFLNKFDPI